MSIELLQLGGNKSDLLSRLSEIADGVVRVFRQSLATNGFNLGVNVNSGLSGSLNITNLDLQRSHGIIQEIGSRGVFFECYQDEVPEAVLDSIDSARQALREEIKGVWADRRQEQLVQDLQQALTIFSNKYRRINPFPKEFNHPTFQDFLKALADLRLEVWSIIAALKIIHGGMINPRNLPADVLEAVVTAKGKIA